MGIGDRDYMRKTEEDEKRITSFEDDLFEQEYGEPRGGRRGKSRAGKVWIAVALALAIVAAWWLCK